MDRVELRGHDGEQVAKLGELGPVTGLELLTGAQLPEEVSDRCLDRMCGAEGNGGKGSDGADGADGEENSATGAVERSSTLHDGLR